MLNINILLILIYLQFVDYLHFAYLCTVKLINKQIKCKKMRKKIKAISPIIQKLEVGEQVEFAIEKIFSVRTIACTKGLELDRKYKTTVDRKKRVIIVTRIS